MARINIEDSLFKDSRFFDLCIKLQSKRIALGGLVEAWVLAQSHVSIENPNGRVPLSEWLAQGILNEIIESKLAFVIDDHVEIVGGAKNFSWLVQKKEAAKKGGESKKANGSNKKKTKKNSSASGKRSDSDIESDAKLTTAADNPPTLTPTLTPTLSPSLDSSSNSEFNSFSENSENEINDEPNAQRPAKMSKTQFFIKTYCECFKKKYKTDIDFSGKDAGIAKRIAKDLTEEKIELYLQAFFQMPDSWLVKTKHPISAFESKKNEIVVFANSGNFTTRNQANQIEKDSEYQAQLDYFDGLSDD